MAKRGHYIQDAKLRLAIENLAVTRPTWPPTQIERALRGGKWKGKFPSLRTIQTMVKELRQPDKSGPWALATAQGDEALLVLPVVAAVALATKGEQRQVTRAEADWIKRIRRLARDLDLWAVYRLARLYLLREARGETTEDLDLYLAFAPWHSPEAKTRYMEMVTAGRIPQGPMFLVAEEAHEKDADLALLHDEITSSPEVVESLRRTWEEMHRLGEQQKGEQS